MAGLDRIILVEKQKPVAARGLQASVGGARPVEPAAGYGAHRYAEVLGQRHRAARSVDQHDLNRAMALRGDAVERPGKLGTAHGADDDADEGT